MSDELMKYGWRVAEPRESACRRYVASEPSALAAVCGAVVVWAGRHRR